jgi:hypothetical protein
MKHTNILAVCLVATLALLSACSSATTSTGTADPVSGTWVGEWGPSPSRQTEVTVELKWDGTTLKGTVDPDRNGIELATASFDPKTSAVTMELDGPNSSREIVRYKIEGKISGTTMSGTFDRAGEKGTFEINKK